MFAEDVTPETLKAFRAVLVVGQRVEFEPKLSTGADGCGAAGVGVFYDGTSRPEVVSSFRPLGASFDRMDGDRSPWQDDSAYLRIPAYFEKHAELLNRVLGASVAPVADVDIPGVLLTERASGQARFVWVVDNVEPDLDPGLAWRTGLILSQRVPLAVPVGLKVGRDEAVYDVFGRRQVRPTDGHVDAICEASRPDSSRSFRMPSTRSRSARRAASTRDQTTRGQSLSSTAAAVPSMRASLAGRDDRG